MFRTVEISNIPMGNAFREFRKELLIDIQYATAGHWQVDNEKHIVNIIYTQSHDLLEKHINMKLHRYCKQHAIAAPLIQVIPKL